MYHEYHILDFVREVRAPFSPEAVVAEFAADLKRYRVTLIVGDRYAGEWPVDVFRKHGSPAFETCANSLCKRQYPVGRRAEHLMHYPRCNPNPLPEGWVQVPFGEGIEIAHEWYSTMDERGLPAREACRFRALLTSTDQILARIERHMREQHP